MIFRQFHESASSALSYLVGDPITREAALIDGVRGQVSQYLATLKQLGLVLVYLLETHVHEDHRSVAPLLKEMTGARLGVHEQGRVRCADLQLREGDVVYVGEEAIETMYTPGHSACSVTYRWRDRLCTGDTLLVGTVGACTGLRADAEQLYESIHERLYTQPGELLVYPGREIAGHRVSSIEQERLTNRDLPYGRDREAFIAARRVAFESPSAQRLQCMQLNQTCANGIGT